MREVERVPSALTACDEFTEVAFHPSADHSGVCMSKAPFELLQLVRSSLAFAGRRHALPLRLSCHHRPLINRYPFPAQQRASLWGFSSNNLASLEKTAQADLSNVPAQLALYKAYLEKGAAQDKAAYSHLVSRFEQDAGLFKPKEDASRSTALLANPEAWESYLKALVQIDQEAPIENRIQSATNARMSLLSAPLASLPAADLSNDSQSTVPLTNEQIATAVLSRDGSQNVRLKDAPGSSPAYAGTAGAASISSAATAAKAEPIRVIVEEARGNVFFRAFKFILTVAIWSFIALTLLSLLLDGSGLMKAATSRTPGDFQSLNSGKKVTFADVHGCEEAKAELQEVVDFLKDPAKFSALGGKLPKGVLLTGPPGTGKTLLARAVAGEAGVSFLFASGSEFDELFVGVGAKRVRELFTAARKASPCIIFIDELDAIGSKRSPRDAQHMRQTLNQLLTELDGFTQSEGVILLGATNLPQLLDKALTRPGRFDRHVAVPLPDVRGRLKILEHHSKAIKVAQGVNMAQVARGTPGFSGAQLENLINQAAVKASTEGSTMVNLNHIEWAKDKILMGAERLSAVITPESRRKTAFHEAGHALIALYTEGAMPLHRVTVIPRGHSLGSTLQLPEMDRDSESYLELRARIDVAMGGRAAEQVIYGKDNITSGASSDISAATKVANAMVRHYGFSEKLGTVDLGEEERLSTETLHIIENEVRSLIEGAQMRAMNLLQDKSRELNMLAEALITYESLNLEEVTQILKGEKLMRTVI